MIADDSVFVREAVAGALRAHGVEVLAEVGDAESLRTAAADHLPDVAVIDVRMPPTFRTEGLQAALALRRDHPQMGVLVLSAHLETHYLFTLLDDRARGVGYLLKDRVAGISDFVDALHRIAAGACVVDPEVVAAMIASRRGPVALLSPRELAVLALIAEGRSNYAVGEQLHLTKRTVEAHVRHILVRLDLPPAPDDERRVLAVLAYLRSR